MDNKRTFDTKDVAEKDIKLVVKYPTQDDLTEASMYYSVAFSNAIRKGCLTNAEALSIIKGRKLWEEKEKAEAEQIGKDMKELQDKLVDEKDKITGKKIVDKLSETRSKLFELNRIVQGIYENTAESLGDEVRTHVLTALCTFDPDTGDKFFKNYDDYKMRSNETAAAQASYQMSLFLSDVKPDFMLEWPENKWMLENDFIDKDGNLLLDNEGNPIKKEEEKKEKEDKAKTGETPAAPVAPVAAAKAKETT